MIRYGSSDAHVICLYSTTTTASGALVWGSTRINTNLDFFCIWSTAASCGLCCTVHTDRKWQQVGAYTLHFSIITRNMSAKVSGDFLYSRIGYGHHRALPHWLSRGWWYCIADHDTDSTIKTGSSDDSTDTCMRVSPLLFITNKSISCDNRGIAHHPGYQKHPPEARVRLKNTWDSLDGHKKGRKYRWTDIST